MGYPIALGYIPMQSPTAFPPGTGKGKKESISIMRSKRLVSAAIAVILAVCLPVTAFAQTYDLSKGSITVTADENGQYVSQENGVTNELQTSETVITQGDGSEETANTITVDTEDGAEAEVTIKDININSGADSAIDVGDSSLKLTVEGENKLSADGDSAALRVSSGDLTIDGTGSLSAEHNGREGILQDSAKIGSNAGEDMSGNIHITGDVTVTTGGNNSVYHDDGVPGDETFGTLSGGAGIGAGAITEDENRNAKGGNMSGTITIDGSATVNASSGNKYGAGIGTGRVRTWRSPWMNLDDGGDMSGTITIGGNAKVTAKSEGNGAGIGTGGEGDMSGTITIGDNATVNADSADDGAGIGSGMRGDMSGTINIGGSAKVTATSTGDGAGIGSGDDGWFTKTGVINIDGDSDVFAFAGSYYEKGGYMRGYGAGIGSGNDASMSGTINIGGNARVTAASASWGAGIGSGDEEEMSGTVTITDNANVTAVSGKYGAGIGSSGDEYFPGTIIISGSAIVTARGGSNNYNYDTGEYDDDYYATAAAIGAADNSFDGKIMILGNASVTTGIVRKDSVTRENPTGTLADDLTGYIGSNNGGDNYGLIFISDTASVNGVSGADSDGINALINGGTGTDLIPAQVVPQPDGGLKLVIEKEGITVSDILYGGSAEVPTEPGEYPITAVVVIDGNKTVVPLGTLIIPEPERRSEDASEPLYRVTDKAGTDIGFRTSKKDGVLTITVDADTAVFTGKLTGLETLKALGTEVIVFETKEAVSSFRVSDLLDKGKSDDIYRLIHEGATAAFTVGEANTDVSGILIKP